MKSRKIIPILFLFMSISGGLYPQGSDNYGKGLRVDLDESGDKYVRFLIWNQIWLRNTEHNPNSMVNEEPRSNTWDISARRLRMLVYAQVSPRFLVLTHFGVNNQTFSSGGAAGSTGTGAYGSGKKPGLFIHDAWGEFTVVPAYNRELKKDNPFSLYAGAGMHYWNGISRMSSASTLNFMTIDAPIFNWPLIEYSDQFARQFGIYAKGSIEKLNYSISVNKPFATNQTPHPDPLKGSKAVDNNGDPALAVQGYFDYQFLDKESTKLPYRVGSYLGTKKVLNIGAGFYHAGRSTKSLTLEGNIQQHPIRLFGADVFADLPIGPKEKNMAITAYSVFYKHDFGPNYIRTIGIMNPSSGFDPNVVGNNPIQGSGNSRFLLGTGNIWYTQAGLLLPSRKKRTRVQPFVAYAHKKLDYLDQAGHYFDFGANILIDGHHAKITPQYSTRPLYYEQGGQRTVNGNRGEFMIQLQIYL